MAASELYTLKASVVSFILLRNTKNNSQSIKNVIIGKLQNQPPEIFSKKVILKNLVKFTGNHLCQRRFYKVLGRPEACNFI